MWLNPRRDYQEVLAGMSDAKLRDVQFRMAALPLMDLGPREIRYMRDLQAEREARENEALHRQASV